jgi:hypothetical protein
MRFLRLSAHNVNAALFHTNEKSFPPGGKRLIILLSNKEVDHDNSDASSVLYVVQYHQLRLTTALCGDHYHCRRLGL